MIDLTATYNDLIELFQTTPNATLNQFATAVEGRGHATKVEATAFADAFVASAIELLVLPAGSGWDEMTAKVRSVSLDQAVKAAGRIAEVIRRSDVFRIPQLEAAIAALDEQLVIFDRYLANAVLGKTEIEDRFPPSELRDDMLLVLDEGVARLTGIRAAGVRKRAELVEALGTV